LGHRRQEKSSRDSASSAIYKLPAITGIHEKHLTTAKPIQRLKDIETSTLGLCEASLMPPSIDLG
jgi:hypothetical protein